LLAKLILVLFLFTQVVVAKSLSVAIYDFPPVFIVNNNDKPGYCYEIVEHLYTRLGYQVSKVELNFPRAMKSVENQEIDIVCAVNSFNSQELALSKEPLVNIAFYFWAHKDSDFYYDGISSLAGRGILNITGFNYTPASPAYQNYLEQNDRQVNYLTGDQPLRRAFNMLALGRADTIALDRDNAFYNLKKLNIQSEIKLVGKLPNVLKGYVGVSKSHPQRQRLLNQFDEEYPKLLESGFVESIHQKYDVYSPQPQPNKSLELER
jgi:polar amino acid transport system substrate-binding protein